MSSPLTLVAFRDQAEEEEEEEENNDGTVWDEKHWGVGVGEIRDTLRTVPTHGQVQVTMLQRRAIRLIGDPALTCHLQPLSHRRGVLLVTSHFSTVIQTDSAPPS
nr:unnamed protein product [Callosobruchus chinensis]